MATLSNSELRRLLEKESQGTLTNEEQQRLDEWYNAFDQENQKLAVFEDHGKEAEIKNRLFRRIMEKGFPEEVVLIPKKRTFSPFVPWSCAAAIVLMVLGGWFWYARVYHPADDPLLYTQSGQGRLKHVRLEDGTEIWLNAMSKLGYPAHFSRDTREVYLDGEGFFQVKEDPKRPFVVHTSKLSTHVLGTSFTVTAYREQANQRVMVKDGKVEVLHEKQSLGFLTANKLLEYSLVDGKAVLADVNAEAQVGWKEGRLQFENQTIQDIAARLARWYGYTFKFEHAALWRCSYTASFNSNIPLPQLLKVMKAISLIDYEIDNKQKTVTFLGQGCNN